MNRPRSARGTALPDDRPRSGAYVDRAAELQRQREESLSKMEERVASLERKHQEKHAATPTGASGTTSSLRREIEKVGLSVG
jgi:hypothetical protein